MVSVSLPSLPFPLLVREKAERKGELGKGRGEKKGRGGERESSSGIHGESPPHSPPHSLCTGRRKGEGGKEASSRFLFVISSLPLPFYTRWGDGRQEGDLECIGEEGGREEGGWGEGEIGEGCKEGM